MSMARMQQRGVQLRFVAQKQETFGGCIETPERINAPRKTVFRECVGTAIGCAKLRDAPERFVKGDEHEV